MGTYFYIALYVILSINANKIIFFNIDDKKELVGLLETDEIK